MRGLYAIIDPAFCEGEPIQIAEAVLRGGCAALQLRDKRADDASFLALARQLAGACRARGVPFFINDRVWLAEHLPSCGVHVGQDDMPIAEVRARLGPRSIGVSTHSLAQAEAAARAGADLLGFGPVFATASKLDSEPVVGLPGLQQVCARIAKPIVAIGGVNQTNAADVARCGAPLAAAISAICAATSPEDSARELHALLGGTVCE
jgi:thiamine-phosphate pyrophosphorylase